MADITKFNGGKAFEAKKATDYESIVERIDAPRIIEAGTADEDPVDTGGDIPRLKRISAYDLYRADIPAPVWAVEGLVPQGLTVLGAPPKSGKSYFCLQLALSITNGKSFLGLKTAQGPVLYFGLEDTESRLRSRMTQVSGDSNDFRKDLDFLMAIPRLNENGLLILENELKITRPVLCVLDTWGRCKPYDRKPGENAYESDTRVVANIKAVADRTGCNILMSTHLKKGGGREGDWLESLTGSMGLVGGADGILAIDWNRDKNTPAILKRDGRDFDDTDPIGLEWLEPGWRYDGNAREKKASDERQEIIKAIREAGESVSIAYISSAVGKKQQNVRFLVGKMVHDRLLVRTSRGQYDVPREREMLEKEE